MSVSAHIFRKEDILPTIPRYEMTMPHHLEIAIRKNPPARPLMLCFDKPKIVNNLANQVQTRYPYANLGISLYDLEKRFLRGDRLSLEHVKEKAKDAKDSFVKIYYQWEAI